MGVIAALVAVAATASGQGGQNRSVAAEFVRYLDPPGSGNDLLRPSSLYIDRKTQEILVAESGHNRVVIFGRDGTYRYEFGGGGRFSLPLDLAVDSEGYILILGSTAQGGRVFVYDFDGAFVATLDGTAASPDGEPADYRNLALDAEDRIYLLDHAGLRVVVFRRDGTLLSAFPVFETSDGSTASDLMVGNLTVAEDRVLVTAPAEGAVHVFGLDGRAGRTIGYKGTTVGQLNFPIDVAVSDGGRVYVLDKTRFCVVCFGPDGKFLGEFGGRGFSPGWFYHPSLLEADGEGRVCIGQLFQNRVQLCAVPGFILENPTKAAAGPESQGPHFPAGNRSSVHHGSVEGGGSPIGESELLSASQSYARSAS